jgi:hypothetical protein
MVKKVKFPDASKVAKKVPLKVLLLLTFSSDLGVYGQAARLPKAKALIRAAKTIMQSYGSLQRILHLSYFETVFEAV